MDKHSKLQRYGHKDYSDLVDFPVEIVGRDGVIRRYSFEDSVRLYQRRVTFAPIRFRDAELISAEVAHCRHRIDQLRRSYFFRFGWGTPDGQAHPEEVFGDIAGEIAAFLVRVLRSDGRPDVRVEPVEPAADGSGAWFVVPGGAADGMTLYVHRFYDDERDAARERFFGVLKRLERGDDEERLVAFHHSADCGFLLTAPRGRFEALVSLTDDDGIIRDVSPTLWERALDQVRLGRYADALDAAEQVVSAHAMDRRAYVLGAALAEHLDRPVDLLSFAQIGALYFPDDPDLRLWLGVARARTGDDRGAIQPLEALLRSRPSSALARAALLPVLLRELRIGRAVAVALRPPDDAADDPALAAARLDAARATTIALSVVALGAASQVLGVVCAVVFGWLGLIVMGLGLLLTLAAALGYAFEVRRLLGRSTFGDVAWWARRVGASNGAPPVA